MSRVAGKADLLADPRFFGLLAYEHRPYFGLPCARRRVYVSGRLQLITFSWRYLGVRNFILGQGSRENPSYEIPVEVKILAVAAAVVSVVGLAILGFSWI